MMRRWMAAGFAVLALAAVSGFKFADEDQAAWVEKMKKDGFEPAFDGKTLSGWKTADNPESWTALEDGTIHGMGDRSHLFSPKEYTDVEFVAQIKLNKGGNSGMYFRTKFGPEWPEGYEAQVNNSSGDPQKTGSLYRLVRILKSDIPDDTWWTQHVIVKGNHIVIKINDKVVVDYKDEKNTHTKGHLAIQQHDPGSKVWYRNVMIKDLAK